MAFLRRRRRAQVQFARKRQPGLGIVPGIVGSLSAFFSLPALGRFGVEVPWPWLWILLPLAVDALARRLAR